MARQLITGDYLEAASAVVLGDPFTMFAWYKPNALTSNVPQILCISDFSLGNRVSMDLVESSGVMRIFCNGSTDSTTNTATAGVWNSFFYSMTASNTMTGILNGDTSANKASVTGGNQAAGLDRTSIGRIARPSPFPSMNGSIAYVTVWNVALSDADAVALDAGVHPFRIKPQSIVAHWPLNEDGAAIDIVGRLQLAENGVIEKVEGPLLARGRSIYIPSIAVVPPAVANPIVMII